MTRLHSSEIFSLPVYFLRQWTLRVRTPTPVKSQTLPFTTGSEECVHDSPPFSWVVPRVSGRPQTRDGEWLPSGE